MSPCSRSSESLVHYTRPFIFPCSPVSIPNPVVHTSMYDATLFFNNDITLNNDVKINDNYYFLEGSLEPPLHS